MQLLSFSLNEVDYGIPLTDVESIEGRINCVNIPTAPKYIKGIIKLHGNIVPVLSLAARFGLQERPVENMIVANVDGMKLALEVEKVKEIVDVENSHVLPMPMLMNSVQNCFNDVASCQQELIVMLDVKSLITLEDQQQLRKLIEDSSNENYSNEN